MSGKHAPLQLLWNNPLPQTNAGCKLVRREWPSVTSVKQLERPLSGKAVGTVDAAAVACQPFPAEIWTHVPNIVPAPLCGSRARLAKQRHPEARDLLTSTTSWLAINSWRLLIVYTVWSAVSTKHTDYLLPQQPCEHWNMHVARAVTGTSNNGGETLPLLTFIHNGVSGSEQDLWAAVA